LKSIIAACIYYEILVSHSWKLCLVACDNVWLGYLPCDAGLTCRVYSEKAENVDVCHFFAWSWLQVL